MPARHLLPAAALSLATVLAGCTSATAGSGAPAAAGSTDPGRPAGPGADLVRGDACAEVFFWAASASGETAVTVQVDIADRTDDGPSEYVLELPHPDVAVAVLTGPGDLTENFCTDALVGVEPTGEQSAVAGTVRITVDPPGEDCGQSDGGLRIEGLVAQDGTTFPPIVVRSVLVGCNVGA